VEEQDLKIHKEAFEEMLIKVSEEFFAVTNLPLVISINYEDDDKAIIVTE
jgi:hypothetical protein